ncbi:hypothetical protein ACVXZY_03675 [Staphylococcus aureus]
MPIVPGVLITNAIQDLFGGHVDVHNEIIRSISYGVLHWCWRW